MIGFLYSLIIATALTRFGYVTSSNHVVTIAKVLTIIAVIFAFLWINVMIFDVWWILRYLSPAPGTI